MSARLGLRQGPAPAIVATHPPNTRLKFSYPYSLIPALFSTERAQHVYRAGLEKSQYLRVWEYQYANESLAIEGAHAQRELHGVTR
jgi:hypothetical protein